MMRNWLAAALLACGLAPVACSGDDTTATGGSGGTAAATTTSSHGGETSQGGAIASGGGDGATGAHAGGAAQGGSTSSGGSGPVGGNTGEGGQGVEPMACDQPNPDGAELVELVNAYRAEHSLPAIPYSPSLSCVAVTHVHDMADYPADSGAGCNLHSWSDHGSWTACCYTPDHAQAQCMWDKPRELTDYPGNGYENAAAGAGSPAAALAMWQGSSAHNDVILNQGMWAGMPWGAIGAGLYQGYAVLWFGQEADPGR
jgi:uncharacterized protein YkwD